MDDLVGLDTLASPPVTNGLTNGLTNGDDIFGDLENPGGDTSDYAFINDLGKPSNLVEAVVEIEAAPVVVDVDTNDVYATVDKTKKSKKKNEKANGSAPAELDIFSESLTLAVPNRSTKQSAPKPPKQVSWADSSDDIANTPITSPKKETSVTQLITPLDGVISEHPPEKTQNVQLPQFSSDWGSVLGSLDDGKEERIPKTQME